MILYTLSWLCPEIRIIYWSKLRYVRQLRHRQVLLDQHPPSNTLIWSVSLSALASLGHGLRLSYSGFQIFASLFTSSFCYWLPLDFNLVSPESHGGLLWWVRDQLVLAVLVQ